MGLETGIGMLFGAICIWAGYTVRTKKEFYLLAGFRETWQPINRERLGNRIGILLILMGVIAILTAIFTIWFGATAEKISGIFALIDVIMIILVIVLDQIGF